MESNKSLNVLREISLPGISKCNVGSKVKVVMVSGEWYKGTLSTIGPYATFIELSNVCMTSSETAFDYITNSYGRAKLFHKYIAEISILRTGVS